MKKIAISLGAAICFMSAAAHAPRTLLDDNWEYRSGDDAEWTIVDLPHDASIAADFDRSAPAGNDGGYLPAGKAFYRKTIEADSLVGEYTLVVEGAYMNSAVRVNGHRAGHHAYGYSTMRYPITHLLRKGMNVIEIDTDNSAQKNCRWYSGTGLYRHVWLEQNRGGIHDIFITTPDYGREVKVQFKGNPENVTAEITDNKGKYIGGATADDKGEILFKKLNLQRWSPENPMLYNLTITKHDSTGNIIEKYAERFGVRTVEYSAEKGLTLNGEPIDLNGGCVHHDNGALGARSYDAAEYRKAKLLKDAGFNAVRTSHNPPAPAFLDACDELGLLVIDEAFDGWKQAKTPYDYSRNFDTDRLDDISLMVLRDRNHPSVICWSIGNEILERKSPKAVEYAAEMAAECRRLDPTRPVTQTLAAWDDDWEIYDPLAAQHEIIGYNYMLHKAEDDHRRVPRRIIWQTESYPRDAFKNWQSVNANKYVIGDFVWTAIDYLGESGIGRHYYDGDPEGEHWERDLWPWHGACCGDIDITGHRKPISHYRELLWNPYKTLYMAVREPQTTQHETLWGTYPSYESWTWPGNEGQDIDVEVYSRHPLVRLICNGQIVAEKPVNSATEFKATFTLPYRPGTLTAQGIGRDGTVEEEFSITTAGTPAALRLTADKHALTADNQDLVYIIAQVVDAAGNVVPIATDEIEFSVAGPGTVIATASADMKDLSGYHHSRRKTSQGRAMAVVKASHTPGEIIIKASSDGLTPAQISVTSLGE